MTITRLIFAATFAVCLAAISVFAGVSAQASSLDDINAAAKLSAGKVAKQILRLVDEPGATELRFHANAYLNGDRKITRAIIMLHGSGDDGSGWAENLHDIAADRKAASSTLIIAPWFIDDLTDPPLPENAPKWSGVTEWLYGLNSKTKPGISSFAALDVIVDKLADRQRFPNLKTIVVAGFSAGGQMADRYGIIGQALPRAEAAGISVRLVVGGARTYTYFSEQRIGSDGTMAKLSDVQSRSCSEANSWPYGMTKLPTYRKTPDATETEKLMRAYFNRKPLYLMGALDSENSSDNGCGERIEGISRRNRLENYAKYLESLGQKADVVLVESKAHTGSIFNHKRAIDALFD
jgi:hypothetical protein